MQDTDAGRLGRELGWDVIVHYPIEEEDAAESPKKREEIVRKNKIRRNFLWRLRKLGFIVAQQKSVDEDDCLLKIAAPTECLERQAERIGMEMRSKKVDKKTGRNYYLEFSRDEKDQFLPSSSRFFSSLERQRLIMSLLEEKIELGGAGLNIQDLKKNKILYFVPLHEEAGKKHLADNWLKVEPNFSGFLKLFSSQPVDEIRDYFGEKIALYFSWLDWYTKFLMPLSFVGLIVFLVQVGYGLDYSNLATVIYAALICFWSTLFVETWKRKEATLAFYWDVQDFEEEERVRPEFYGEEQAGVFTKQGDWVDLSYKLEEGTPKESVPHTAYFNHAVRLRRIAGSVSVLLVFLFCLVIGTFSILAFRVFVQANDKAGAIGGGIVAGIVNGIFIAFMNTIYSKIAESMNIWENHRTETDYEDKLIAKQFSFKFVNSFSSLAFIAFAKSDPVQPWLENIPAENWPKEFPASSQLMGLDIGRCKGTSCMSELFTQLMTLQLTMIFVSNFSEILLPLIVQKIRVVLNLRNAVKTLAKAGQSQRRSVQPTNPEDTPMPEFEKQTCSPVYGGVLEDYTELMIQYGYITLFACAFPLSSLCALINNIAEVRVDGFKLLFGTQRPIYRGAEDIGTWQAVLEFTSILAVVSNCAIICFTSGVLRGDPRDRSSAEYGTCVSDCSAASANLTISINPNDWLNVSNVRFALDEFSLCLKNCSCESPINTCYSLVTRIWVFIIVEHLIIGAKLLLEAAIPDKPAFVAQAEARAQVERTLMHWKDDSPKLTPEEVQDWETCEYSSNVWDKEN